MTKKDEEIDTMTATVKSNQENYERVQLKLLSYRKEDILDLLSSLKEMASANGMKASEIKRKSESLHVELLKIDNELFELEKKYGEFKVRKPMFEESPKASASKSEQIEQEDLKDEDGVIEPIPVVEESRLSEQEEAEQPSDTQEEEVQQEPEVKMSRAEIVDKIQELESKIAELEQMIE